MREYSRREGSAFKLSPPWCCSATARHPDEPRHSRNTGAGAWCRWGRGGRQRHALSVVELQAEQLGGMRTAKDSAAGLLSAVSQTVVGQPFNTVKVRMQVASGPPLDGPLSLAASILRSEGVGGFYRGALPMLLGQQVTNITLFATYQQVRRFLEPDYAFVGSRRRHSNTCGSHSSIAAAGFVAGIANSFILCPVELVTVRLQVQSMGRPSRASGVQCTNYRGPVDCLRQVIAQEGLARVFTGLRPTMAREAVGVTCWFSAYEAARRNFQQRTGADPVGWQVAVCGTAGGVSFWSVAFPLDVAKSRLQTQGPTSVRLYTGVIDCLGCVVREEGVSALYSGYSTAVVRAAFVGAAVFSTYETVRAALG